MMKKIFIFISIVLLFKIDSIYAQTLEYDIPIDNPLFNLINTEKRYAWYKEELVSIGYSNDEDIDLKNTYIDKDDMIFEYSDWMEYRGISKDNLEYRTLYNYKTILPLKVIEISANKITEISEIELYVDSQKINYDIACTNCAYEEIEYLKDENINNNDIYNLNTRGKILLVLDKEYPLNKLEIKIYKTNKNDDSNINIKFTKDQYNYDNTIISNPLFIDKIYNEDIKYNTFKIDDTWIFNVEYGENNISEEYIEDSWYTKTYEYIEYREVTKKYHYYNIKKEYVEGYYKDNPNIEMNLKKDENNYKIFYQYEYLNNNLNIDENINSDFNSLLSNLNYSNLDFQIPSFSIDDLIQKQNNIDLNSLYNLNNYNEINNLNKKIEDLPKVDTSNYKTNKVKENNISKYFNMKNLKIVGSIIISIILIILLINSRYRKS